MVQLDCDKAVALDVQLAVRHPRGVWGLLESTKGTSAWIHPFATEAPAAGASRKAVPAARLVQVASPPAAPRPWRKNAGWLGADHRARIKETWCLEDDVEVPGEKTLLSESQLAVACVEVGWRILLPRCLVVPPYLCGLVAHHVMNHDASRDGKKEGEVLVSKLVAYAQRAVLLCLPIICSGHWTLLVLQRGDAPKEAEKPVDDGKKPMDEGMKDRGCSKCGTAGCMHCAPEHAARWSARLSAEEKFFDPCSLLPPLPEATWWDIRYYDSLRATSSGCARCAVALLDALQTAGVHNVMTAGELGKARRNTAYQRDATSCGYWATHYVETEFRRYAGEGDFAFPFARDRRAELAGALIKRFRE